MAKARKSVQELLETAAPAPTTEALVVAFMRFAGGPEKFAKMLYDEFIAATAGGITRQRILEAIMRGMSKIDSEKNPLANLGNLSPEDLDRLIDEKMAAIKSKEGEDAQSP